MSSKLSLLKKLLWHINDDDLRLTAWIIRIFNMDYNVVLKNVAVLSIKYLRFFE